MRRTGPISRPVIFALVALFLLTTNLPLVAASGADADWQAIEKLEQNPPATEYKSREQARGIVLRRLAEQESALRDFRNRYPNDERAFQAGLQLARVLSVQSDLMSDYKRGEASMDLLDEMAANRNLPDERKADIDFARLSLQMRKIDSRDAKTRDWITREMAKLREAWPNDRRVPRIMVEVATFYDAQPKRKAEILSQARRLTSEEELRMRIDDDLKRLEMLGRPLDLSFESMQGRKVAIKDFKGSVVVVFFFAEWSPPAMAGLADLATVLGKFRGKATAIGISLDQTPAAAKVALDSAGLDIPVYFDGKGWESPQVREWGINVLPTVWVLDREGILRVIYAREDLEGVVRTLTRER